jgi:putative RecB family exonuclease
MGPTEVIEPETAARRPFVALSPSAISAFKSCPLAFRLSYLERIPQPPSVPATRGTLVHAALERLMLAPGPERTPERARACLAEAAAAYADHPEMAGLELGPDETAAMLDDAAQLLDGYFALEDPTRVRPIGLELRMRAQVGRVRLSGVIDRLELDGDGELVVTDYKTGAAPSERREQQTLAPLHLYATLVEQVIGHRPVRVQLLYLAGPEAIRADTDARAAAATIARAEALWSAIGRARARDDFRARPGPLCEWCGYRPHCPAHGGDLAALLATAAPPADACAR